MALINFSVVLVGENFPLQSIKTSDFRYRHRALNETLRLPVAIQAENNLVLMQVLPDRFEARIKSPDDLELQAEGLAEMVTTFLEYVGKRTVTAVGHNAQWALPGDQKAKRALVGRFVNMTNLEEVTGGAPSSEVDLSFSFKVGAESKARVALSTSATDGALLDCNFHFDISSPDQITSAMAEIPNSLRHVQAIGEAMDRQNSVVGN